MHQDVREFLLLYPGAVNYFGVGQTAIHSLKGKLSVSLNELVVQHVIVFKFSNPVSS